MEALQSARLQVKKEIQTERKQQKEKQKEKKKETLLPEEASGNPNGWTDLELPEKTRYLFIADASGTGRGRCFFTGFHIR
jgi:hypothetical protein